MGTKLHASRIVPNRKKIAVLIDPDKHSDDSLKKLIQKAEKSQSLSELDNMAIAGIISTQFLHNHFINYKKLNVPSDYTFNLFIDRRS